MLIIPAIDLQGGRVVRLLRGDFSTETVYGDDPIAVARRWVEAGATYLHVVDLDGARTGQPQHVEVIRCLVRVGGARVEVGGGVRTREAVERYLACGVDRVVIGTKACLDAAFLAEVARAIPGRLAVAVDTRRGAVVTDGWTKTAGVEVDVLVQRVLDAGVTTVIFTDVARDGTLVGPSVRRLRRVLQQCGQRARVIASGGIGSLDDLVRLKTLEPLGLMGVIVGKALYEGRVDLAEAIHRC